MLRVAKVSDPWHTKRRLLNAVVVREALYFFLMGEDLVVVVVVDDEDVFMGSLQTDVAFLVSGASIFFRQNTVERVDLRFD